MISELYNKRLSDSDLTIKDLMNMIDERVGILLEDNFERYFMSIPEALRVLCCTDMKIRMLVGRKKIRFKKILHKNSEVYLLWKPDVMELKMRVEEGEDIFKI